MNQRPHDRFVMISEVGPRDGLQNQPIHIPTPAKIKLVDDLSGAGFKQIECTSFVHPKRVPAMADAEQVFAGLKRQPGTRYLALVPNTRGYERARASGCDAVAVFTAASEAFTKRNINMTVEGSLDRFLPVAKAAAEDGASLRGYVSTIYACPFAGRVSPEQVIPVVDRLLEMGCYEVSLGDTIGIGRPNDTRRLLEAVLKRFDVDRIAMHFHDTWGMGTANLLASLEFGVWKFDASAGGLGGCPYAPDATGNVATEDVVYLLDGLGWDTGIDLDKVVDAVSSLAEHLDYRLPGRVYNATRGARRRAELDAAEAAAKASGASQ